MRKEVCVYCFRLQIWSLINLLSCQKRLSRINDTEWISYELCCARVSGRLDNYMNKQSKRYKRSEL